MAAEKVLLLLIFCTSCSSFSFDDIFNNVDTSTFENLFHNIARDTQAHVNDAVDTISDHGNLNDLEDVFSHAGSTIHSSAGSFSNQANNFLNSALSEVDKHGNTLSDGIHTAFNTLGNHANDFLNSVPQAANHHGNNAVNTAIDLISGNDAVSHATKLVDEMSNIDFDDALSQVDEALKNLADILSPNDKQNSKRDNDEYQKRQNWNQSVRHQNAPSQAASSSAQQRHTVSSKYENLASRLKEVLAEQMNDKAEIRSLKAQMRMIEESQKKDIEKMKADFDTKLDKEVYDLKTLIKAIKEVEDMKIFEPVNEVENNQLANQNSLESPFSDNLPENQDQSQNEEKIFEKIEIKQKYFEEKLREKFQFDFRNLERSLKNDIALNMISFEKGMKEEMGHELKGIYTELYTKILQMEIDLLSMENTGTRKIEHIYEIMEIADEELRDKFQTLYYQLDDFAHSSSSAFSEEIKNLIKLEFKNKNEFESNYYGNQTHSHFTKTPSSNINQYNPDHYHDHYQNYNNSYHGNGNFSRNNIFTTRKPFKFYYHNQTKSLNYRHNTSHNYNYTYGGNGNEPRNYNSHTTRKPYSYYGNSQTNWNNYKVDEHGLKNPTHVAGSQTHNHIGNQSHDTYKKGNNMMKSEHGEDLKLTPKNTNGSKTEIIISKPLKDKSKIAIYMTKKTYTEAKKMCQKDGYTLMPLSWKRDWLRTTNILKKYEKDLKNGGEVWYHRKNIKKSTVPTVDKDDGREGKMNNKGKNSECNVLSHTDGWYSKQANCSKLAFFACKVPKQSKPILI